MLNVVLALSILFVAQAASAYPNMIRLGYVACATCHVSPQGGGVLTRYGRGIDYAQTIRAGEPPEPSGRAMRCRDFSMTCACRWPSIISREATRNTASTRMSGAPSR